MRALALCVLCALWARACAQLLPPDAEPLRASVGGFAVMNCHLDFPFGNEIPYRLQWDKDVSFFSFLPTLYDRFFATGSGWDAPGSVLIVYLRHITCRNTCRHRGVANCGYDYLLLPTLRSANNSRSSGEGAPSVAVTRWQPRSTYT